MRKAHITSRPGQNQVGDRVIALCGKQFKVKIAWVDIPANHPICRACVDKALVALTDADRHLQHARLQVELINLRLDPLTRELGEESVLDEIVQAEQDYQHELERKAEEKAAAQKVTQTCTCVWESQEIFQVDENCPIHGGQLDAIGVEISEGKRPVEDVELPKEDQ